MKPHSRWTGIRGAGHFLRTETDTGSLIWPFLAASAAATALAAVMFVIVGLLASPSWLQLGNLAARGVHTRATVTSTDPGNHDECHFSFTALGQTYNGSDASCGAPRDGAHVSVTYDPTNPSVVTANDPGESLRSEIGMYALIAIAFWFFVFIGARKFQRWLHSG